MKLFRVSLLSALVLILVLLLVSGALAAPGTVEVLTIKGIINPVVSGYVQKGIEQAITDNASLIVIMMDTPGGFDSSMREIIQAIINSPVPVAVYVAPAGGRAASAGVFITMSAHVAAMAPRTTIGAAHPVAIGTGGQVAQLPSEMEEKILNDAVAHIRSIAGGHNRNLEWAERAVRESVAVTAEEAVNLNVVDLIAPDLPLLLEKIDGRKVTLIGGKEVVLNTRNAAVKYMDMNFAERFLYVISNPNIAYLLLSLAMLGIFFELSNPGSILPGVVGGISLLLALFSLDMLPVNYAGILLIVLAFIMFVAEVFMVSHGILTIGGIVSMVIGSLVLFSGRSPVLEINRWLIATVVIIIAGFFAFVVAAVARSQRRRSTTGEEGLVGRTAVVKQALDPKGTVLLEGELWEAISKNGKIEPGEEVTVTRADGLKVEVVKKIKTGG